jgi:hypothetical protein
MFGSPVLGLTDAARHDRIAYKMIRTISVVLTKRDTDSKRSREDRYRPYPLHETRLHFPPAPSPDLEGMDNDTLHDARGAVHPYRRQLNRSTEAAITQERGAEAQHGFHLCFAICRLFGLRSFYVN